VERKSNQITNSVPNGSHPRGKFRRKNKKAAFVAAPIGLCMLDGCFGYSLGLW
jgi:hypothetical protein